MGPVYKTKWVVTAYDDEERVLRRVAVGRYETELEDPVVSETHWDRPQNRAMTEFVRLALATRGEKRKGVE